MTPSLTIPVFLLKTRSQPHDAYEEYFAAASSSSNGSSSEDHAGPIFLPEFVPILEHRANTKNLGRLEELLKRGKLDKQYGGMIFTSQRAVEAWADVVKRVERSAERPGDDDEPGGENASGRDPGIGTTSNTTTDHHDSTCASASLLDDDFAFPLYTVGPATSRALKTLVAESSSLESSPFASLRPSVLGEDSGNGEKLAQYILSHYNALHSRRLYTFYDAPRLPFTPLIGPPQGERVDKGDARLQKKPLLFLVGEQRRDIIPNTLMDRQGKLAPDERIQVDEVEVYTTVVMESFSNDFQRRIASCHQGADAQKTAVAGAIVIVVFSPQGCESMLRSLGYIDESQTLTEFAKTRWAEDNLGHRQSATSQQHAHAHSQRYVIVTIGPTTRDHLRNKYGFDPDVCAAKPSPEGVGRGLTEFLKQKGLV
ncbi:hypothetical protein AYO20_04965 [Fonsecaea nubica]|uniref:Tetrapyrrole biosynthesis uroporphyrinogen III synthase domain-containing protein n=1 Tax=Fonsecaea nubica TaxID=856822 RepID=A0A178D408_9EURO|nr:hypothetical protein AYO20_04965 [Fonsecaea nubica]OAL35815.1 hypothetical protein AYO20_04965 [Fonsecaea nubica]